MGKISNKTNGVTEKIRQVLTDEWQTASLIAAQLVFSPEKIARIRTQWTVADPGARSGFVARTLANMPDVEKRKIEGGKNEYRLKRSDANLQQPNS